MDNRLILALDTSGKVASCALLRNGVLLAADSRDALLDHSRTLLELCRGLLEENSLRVADVGLFAAVTGPGSFTGVRIGVAAVKGFGWTLGAPCAGVSSLAAMAYGAEGEGFLCCRVTARQEEYYYAFFRRQGGQVERLSDDAVGQATDIQAQAARYPDCRFLTDSCNATGAAMAAQACAAWGQLTDCHGLNPVYLKRPQAERERQARMNNSQMEP